MKNKRLTEQEQADRLDAYIQNPKLVVSEANPSKIQNPKFVADALREEAESLQAGRPFVAALSEQLRERYAVRPTNFWQWLTRAKGKTMTRLTWGLTVLTTVIATLATVILTQPQALPAGQILAHAAEATLRQPGKVEHIVVETRFDNVATGEQTAYILADWQHIGTTLDGYLTTIEHTSARYAIDDAHLTQPLSWAYETWSKACLLDLVDYPTIYRDPGTDEEGCVTMDQAVRIFIPGIAGQYAIDSPQAWISRLKTNANALTYHEDHLEGKRVYSLIEQRSDDTLILYVDRKTYQPVGFVARTPDYTLTQIVHQYEVVNVGDVPLAPFAWPPTSLAEGFQAIPHP